jgi:hypothetical protein
MHAAIPAPDPQDPRRILGDGVYFDNAPDAGFVRPKSVGCRIECAQTFSGPDPQGSQMINEESPHFIVATARRTRR